MFVTQNRSAASSDPERRRSKMCYKSVYIRLLCMLLTITVTVSAMIVPASAADSELLFQDILPAAAYTKYANGVSLGSAVTPISWFDDVESCAFMWDNRPYEHTFQSYVITMRISGLPKPSSVIFSPFSGRDLKAELVGINGEYFQYRVTSGSNVAWSTVTVNFDTPFTGTVGIYSCVGIRDIGFNMGILSCQEYANYIPYDTGILTKKFVYRTDQLPAGHISKRTANLQSWLNDEVVVTGSFDGTDLLDSMTFFTWGQLATVGVFSILNEDEWPIHVIEPSNIGTKISTTVVSWGEHAWDAVFQEFTVDLSGYDLKNCKWEFSFCVEPSTYNDTYEFTDWHLERIIGRLPIEPTPWYKVFYNWISVKWTDVSNATNKILNSMNDKLGNLVGSSKLNKELTNAGAAMSQQADQMSQANQQMNAVDKPSVDTNTLFGSMLNFNPGGLRVLSVMTNNPMVTSMLVVVFTFALCGYIFFGKKG